MFPLYMKLRLPLMHQSGDVACMHAGFEYIGAGSNRNFCFTDLLLRERRTTDTACLNAANWGTIEVKGPWQLSLPENMSLAEAIAHPDYWKEVLPAVQQVRLHCNPGHQVVCVYEVCSGSASIYTCSWQST